MTCSIFDFVLIATYGCRTELIRCCNNLKISMGMMFKYLLLFLIFPMPVSIYASSGEVLIVFSGEELGSLEPCGCFEGQIGGISRRSSLIDSLRKQKKTVIPVSLGDLPRGFGRQQEIKTEILYRAMDEMGYVAHNLGEKDIEIGLPLISYLSQAYKVKFLSSNVEFAAPLPLERNQCLIKECSDAARPCKIAFIGVVSKSLISEHFSDRINVHDPVEALRPLVKDLRGSVDLIVLLSHAPLEESIEIAKLLPEIGLIITGHGIDDPEEVVTYINNTLIVTAGTMGKRLGVVTYSMDKTGLTRKSVSLMLLGHSQKDSPGMASLLKEYQQMLIDEDLLGKTVQAPLPDGVSYVGSAACGICHKVVYRHWLKTRHGAAYNTLVAIGHQFDPECITCHTTGHGYVSGFLSEKENKNLIDVGCESCHGAGSLHIANVDDKSYKHRSAGEGRCVTCHDSEHSVKFKFDDYWEKIKHPEEVLKKLN